MTKIATTCMQVTFSKEENLKKYFSFIDEATLNGAKLIVFPEQSLQGYLPSLVSMETSTYDYQYREAEIIPTGEYVAKIIKKAIEKNIYIVFGMTEQDDIDYTKLYNTMVLVGPNGYIGKYRKVHQPADELHIYTPGDGFPVFETEIGKIGMLICYDKSFPESTRELALQGAELIIMSTAWPLADPNGDISNDSMLLQYNMYDHVRALENQCFFISSNHFGTLGQITYCAHSRIVSPCGKTIDETGFNEGIAYADVNVRNDIISARVNSMLGLQLLKDRKPNCYKNI